MESSDAEQPVPSCSVTVKCEPATVKEEPEWGECGVSEAAAAEGLYAGHAVKDELVIAPKRMQQLDIAFFMKDVLNIKEENQHEAKPACRADAVAEGLYAGREVKYELDIRPELVEQQDIAYSMQDVLNIEYERKHKPKPAVRADAAPGCIHTRPGEGPRCNRLPVGDLRVSASFSVSRDFEPSYCGVGTRRTRDLSTSQSDFPNHVQTHTHEKPHSCKICCKQFTLRSNLTRHKMIHKAEKPDTSMLARHVRSHTGERPYCCDICHQQFTQQSHLSTHIRIHTGEKPHSCTICRKQFSHRSKLTRHVLTHSAEKPFGCDVCSKRFRDKFMLSRHALLHTGERPFGCDICRQKFSQLSHLRVHRRKHTGEKPYSCDVCSKRFIHKSWLTVHIRIHTVEKPYNCDVCNKRFAAKAKLIAHKLIHSCEKPYSCEVCNKWFRRKSYLEGHMIVHTVGYKLGLATHRFNLPAAASKGPGIRSGFVGTAHNTMKLQSINPYI